RFVQSLSNASIGELQQGANNVRNNVGQALSWFNSQMQQDPSKNPYADRIAKDFTNAMNQQFSEQQLPALRGSQIAAGNVGGSAAGIQTGMAARDLNTTIGRGVNSIYSDAWDSAAQRQQNMMSMLPQMAGLYQSSQMLPGQTLGQIGALNQAQAQMELNNERDRWNYYRDAPGNRLDRYASIVNGTPYMSNTSSGTSRTPGSGSNWADIISGGMLFASPYFSQQPTPTAPRVT
ncbi:MAG: hypothetical protein HC888_07320, partial [Candidatus Competibacteraceae bacterium]|nr:hypothetical protein [Candidatus Competibacteraceae bacterium]